MQPSPAALLLSAKKAAAVAAGQKEETMRVLSQYELACCMKAELSLLLNQIAGELPHLPEGSTSLRNAHINLQNIRRALARPDFRPG
jgi:hypothetical protein